MAKTRKRLKFLPLCVGVVALAVYALFAISGSKGGPTIVPPADEKGIPDVPSFDIPISEIWGIGKETTYFFKVRIPSNVTLVGSFRETSGMCVNFFILNETNMRNWVNDRTYYAYASAKTVGKYNFTFMTDHEGTYYFILDNRETFVHEPCQEKVVIFELKPQE